MPANPHPHPRWALSGVLALASFAGVANAQSAGPPVTNPASGNVYYRAAGSSNVNTLRAFAATLGGRLATINNVTENNWIYDTFVSGGFNEYFIGFSDEAAEGAFVWDSGQTPGFTNWAPNEPNNAGAPPGEDFAVMRFFAPVWFDYRSGASGIAGAIVEIDGSDCLNAVPIAIGATAFGTLAEVSAIPTPCFGDTGPRAWFKVIGNDSPVTMTTCSGGATNFDTFLEVFQGSCAGLACVGFNDDADCGFGGLGSSVNFFAQAGETYYIAVADYHFGTGAHYTFDLTLTEQVVALPNRLGAIFNPGNGRTYVLQDAASPYAARRGAERYNAHLATINDAQENGFVATRFTGVEHVVFIGYTDRVSEGSFAWMDGSPAGYTNWHDGEPNDYNNEDYAVIDSTGRWNDISYFSNVRSVVEFNGDACAQAVPLSVPAFFVGGYRYATHGLSELPCAVPGIDPIGRGVWHRIVGNGEDVTLSTCDPSTNFDTSLRVFVGSCGDMSCITGNEDDGVCTAPGLELPSYRSTITFYAEKDLEYFILVGKYGDAPPNAPDTYALRITTTPVSRLAVTLQTPINTNTCARYLLTEPAVAGRQLREAVNLGGHMASIGDSAENEVIRNVLAVGDAPSALIGLTDRAVEGQFAWLDGAAFSFSNWNPGEPDDSGGEDYVEIASNGRWNDITSLNIRHGVIEVPITAVEGAHIRGGLRFPGSGSNLIVPDNAVPWLDAQYTVECWFRTTTPGVILGQYGLSGGTVPMIYVDTTGRIRAGDWVGWGEGSAMPGPVVNNGQWTHVALTRDGNNRFLIVNGATVASYYGIVRSDYSPSGYIYRIGTGNWTNWPQASGSPDFVGEIDEFRVWNVTRTSAQTRATMDSRFFNPALYAALLIAYSFDDAGGTLVFDAKNHQHADFFSGAVSPTWTYENRDGDKAVDACQPLCNADIDGNGVVNSTDISEFINTWFADQANDTLNADFDRNGVSNSTDVSDLINAYFLSPGECL